MPCLVRRLLVCLSLPILLAAVPSHLPAQFPADLSVSAHAGILHSDLPGGGTEFARAARADLPLGPVLGIEGAVLWTELEQDADTTALILPEVQLQARTQVGRVSPYAGAGVGAAVEWEDDVSLAVSAAVGARIALRERVTGVIDGRVHWLGEEFKGRTMELTIGLRFLLREPPR